MRSLIQRFFLFLFVTWTPYYFMCAQQEEAAIDIEEPTHETATTSPLDNTTPPAAEEVSQTQKPKPAKTRKKKRKRSFRRKKTLQKRRRRKRKEKAKAKKQHDADKAQTERQKRFEEIRQQLLKRKKSLFKMPQPKPGSTNKKGIQPIRKKTTPQTSARKVSYIFTEREGKEASSDQPVGPKKKTAQLIREQRAAARRMQPQAKPAKESTQNATK